MRVSTSLDIGGSAPNLAAEGAIRAFPTALRRQNRVARRAEILRFLRDRAAFDAIIPGLSDLDPGPLNDLLREFRRDPFRQMRVHSRTLAAALVAARYLCWLKLHRPWLLGGSR